MLMPCMDFKITENYIHKIAGEYIRLLGSNVMLHLHSLAYMLGSDRDVCSNGSMNVYLLIF